MSSAEPGRVDMATARHTVAVDLLGRAALLGLDAELIGWADYPDLGEHDWAEIAALARVLAARQFMPTSGAPYWQLADRADGGSSC